MNEQLAFKKLLDEVRSIKEHLTRQIPIQHDLWDSKLVALYLKCSERYVLEHYCTLESFPDKIAPPSKKGDGHPRWQASEVIAWAERYRIKKPKVKLSA